MKPFELFKTDFEFNSLDESYEFNEFVDYIFLRKNTIFVVFKKEFKKNKNYKSHMTKYYKNRGWIKVKFLKQI